MLLLRDDDVREPVHVCALSEVAGVVTRVEVEGAGNVVGQLSPEMLPVPLSSDGSGKDTVDDAEALRNDSGFTRPLCLPRCAVPGEKRCHYYCPHYRQDCQ